MGRFEIYKRENWLPSGNLMHKFLKQEAMAGLEPRMSWWISKCIEDVLVALYCLSIRILSLYKQTHLQKSYICNTVNLILFLYQLPTGDCFDQKFISFASLGQSSSRFSPFYHDCFVCM